MMRKISVILLIILTISIAAFQFNKHRNDQIISDEAAWIFSSVYWNHLVHADFFNADWQGFDAIDHPPLAKYYYGAILDPFGFTEKTIDSKKMWHLKSGDNEDQKVFNLDIKNKIPPKRILIARIGACFLFFLFVFSMYLFGRAAGGRRAGLIAAFLSATNGIVFEIIPFVFSDLLLISLIALHTTSVIRWTKDWNEGRAESSGQQNILSALILALLVSTKYNGGIQVAVVLASSLIMVFQHKLLWKSIIIQTAVGLLITFVFMVILNPIFINFPLAIASLTDSRVHELTILERLSGATGVPVYERIIFALRLIFVDHGWELAIPTIALITVGTIIGLRAILSKEKQMRSTALIISIGTIAWCVPTIWSYKQSLYLRYLLPLLPWIIVTMSVALSAVISWVIGIHSKNFAQVFPKPQRLLWLFGALLTLLFWQLLSGVDIRDLHATYTKNPSFLALQYARDLKAHPTSVNLRLKLAEQYIKLGLDKDALRIIEPIVKSGEGDDLVNALYRLLKERTR